MNHFTAFGISASNLIFASKLWPTHSFILCHICYHIVCCVSVRFVYRRAVRYLKSKMTYWNSNKSPVAFSVCLHSAITSRNGLSVCLRYYVYNDDTHFLFFFIFWHKSCAQKNMNDWCPFRGCLFRTFPKRNSHTTTLSIFQQNGNRNRSSVVCVWFSYFVICGPWPLSNSLLSLFGVGQVTN